MYNSYLRVFSFILKFRSHLLQQKGDRFLKDLLFKVAVNLREEMSRLFNHQYMLVPEEFFFHHSWGFVTFLKQNSRRKQPIGRKFSNCVTFPTLCSTCFS